MKRIVVRTSSEADWQPLLAKPELHWKVGKSAMTSAASWEANPDRLPPQITAMLDASDDSLLRHQRLLAALPEWEVSLPGGVTNSCTDILAICRNESTLCIVGVEAKVFEDFGPPISSKRSEASDGQNARLNYLHELLGVERFDDSVRYQLLHRTASALLTARDFDAGAAVMLVQAFDTPAAQRDDFLAFGNAMHAKPVAPNLFKVPLVDGPALYIGWCDGNPSFFQVQVASHPRCERTMG